VYRLTRITPSVVNKDTNEVQKRVKHGEWNALPDSTEMAELLNLPPYTVLLTTDSRTRSDDSDCMR